MMIPKTKQSVFHKYFGDRAFYRMVIAVLFPIVVQNGVTTFVSMLDNIMVGRLGTEPMAGVSIVNQFLFVFNLLIFGSVSAAGIYMAQFHGRADHEGERNTFRFKILVCVGAAVVSLVILYLLRAPLIRLFLTGQNDVGDPILTQAYGEQYLGVMFFGLLPFAVANAYSSAMRETGDTVTPMAASVIAVAVNFVLNCLLIFGLCGFPRLGVIGAAIATVISRFTEAAILIIRTHRHPDRFGYVTGVYRSLKLPKALAGEISLRGFPLMANELLWALAITFINQAYSTRGLEVVAAENIYSTLWNVFSVVVIGMGSAISIVIGNLLGAGKIEEAKQTDTRMITFALLCGVVTGGLMALCAGWFPRIYETDESVRTLARWMILYAALLMPVSAYTNAAYFTIRSGGKVLVTMLFDSVYMWAVQFPACFILSRFTGMPILPLFMIGQGLEIGKAVLGALLLRRGTWARQL